MDYLRGQGIPVTGNNRVKLLPTGRAKFADLFDAIRQARHHVHLEYFNFRNDSIANALFDLLAQKVKEGVEVRALFDAFGNWSNNKPLREKHIQAIRARGIELVKFDPITFPYVNHALHRDHRKIVVIDGKTGYTGGMNVADYYLTGLPKIGQWHDMHVRIDGDAVRYLQGIFLTTWNRETGQHVGGPEYFADIDIPLQEAEEVAIVDRVPRETPRSISHAYTAAIDSARHTVRIINPYFVPTQSIRTALKQALKRGVKVEIMIPSVSDVPFTPEAALYYVHKLMKRGARIYLDKLEAMPDKVEIVRSSTVTALHGDNALEGVTVTNVNTGEERRLDVQGLFIYVGFEPGTAFLPAAVERDAQGFIVTDAEMRTNVPGIFAAGDVRAKLCRQVITAAGDGATAAQAAFVFLEQLHA